MLLIILMVSFLYTTLQFIYDTFIYIFFCHSSHFFELSLTVFLDHDMMAPHFFTSSSFFQHKKQ